MEKLWCRYSGANPLRRKARTSLFAFVITLLPATLAARDTGSIRGQISNLTQRNQSRRMAVEKYIGKISGKVAPAPRPVAGVWLTGPNLSAPKNPPSVTLAQKGYQFESGLVIVPLNTTILFPNRDPDFHNIYSLSRTKRFDIGRYKKDELPVPSVLFNKEGYIQLNCEIHEHMQAHVIVVNSSLFTISDPAGNFVIKDIPPGNYVLHAQSDSKKKWQTQIVVTARHETRVSFDK